MLNSRMRAAADKLFWGSGHISKEVIGRPPGNLYNMLQSQLIICAVSSGVSYAHCFGNWAQTPCSCRLYYCKAGHRDGDRLVTQGKASPQNGFQSVLHACLCTHIKVTLIKHAHMYRWKAMSLHSAVIGKATRGEQGASSPLARLSGVLAQIAGSSSSSAHPLP